MQYVTRNQLVAKISANGDKFFTALVRKKTDNQLAIIGPCRTGVRKYTTGAGAKYNAAERKLITVHCPGKVSDTDKGYRMINIPGIVEATIGGEVYRVR